MAIEEIIVTVIDRVAFVHPPVKISPFVSGRDKAPQLCLLYLAPNEPLGCRRVSLNHRWK
jgi:hypothetical protein